jgi:hypothetical protein
MCCGRQRSELRNSQAQSVTQNLFGNMQTQAVRTQPSPPPAMRTVAPNPHVNTQNHSVQPQAPTPTSVAQSSISIRYLENSPVRVRGQVSGMYYEFSGSRPVQPVEARDASSLLNTRFFRRA